MVTSDRFACASSLSTHADSPAAVAEVCQRSRESLGATPDLAFLFFTAHHASQAAHLAETACQTLGTECLLGCSGESVVGTGREIEGQPAMALWLATLPDTRIVRLRLDHQWTPEGDTIVGWPEELADEWPAGSALVVLGDPFSFPADVLLARLNEDRAGVPVVGGMASAAARPGENRLLLGRGTYDRGAVAVFLSGAVRLRSVVSQGCRPVGKPFVITQADSNVIQRLGGVPAYERLKEVYQTLATHEQAMLQQGVHVGRVVNEYQDQFEQGDFLVRNVMGVDPDQGSLAIADYVRPGQTVQFHVRDAETADAELRQLLAKVAQDPDASPGGGLLFTCNGRGTRLFSQPHHDAAALHQALGPLPVAGFFAAGELGPIGGRSFVHGFTASVALFEMGSPG